MNENIRRLEDTVYTTAPWCTESQGGTLSEEDLQFLKDNSTVIHYQAGNYIYTVGAKINKFFYINKGIVRYQLINKEGIVKTVFFTDRFLALECFVHKQPAQTNALAMTDVEIYALDKDKEPEIFKRQSICQLALYALSLKCRILGWQVEDLSISTPIIKVCRLLCCYMFNKEDSYVIHLTHQEMAELTGLHRVTITNTMKQLKKMGIIEGEKNGKITIHDWKKLIDIGFDGALETEE